MTKERKPGQKSARDKIMDLLARRNHSELELRQKLSRTYPAHDVSDAIEFARTHNWMLPDEELSGRVATALGRKKKGHRYINQFLRSKGLPPVEKDLQDEIRKGRAIIKAKLDKDGPFDYEERRKIYRILANRGFDDETIRQVLGSVD